MSTTRRGLRLECTSIWCLWWGFAPYSTVVQNYRVIVSTSAAAPSSSSTFHPTVYTLLLYVTNIPYWNTLNPLYRQIQFRLVDARPPLDAGGAFNILQYGVLSSFPGNQRSSHSPSSIVGLVRFCLGSIVTSNDLPPDLHSNHIETYWPCRFGKPFTLSNDADNFSMLQYDYSYRPKPPTACNCSPISRQSAPVVRQRSSSAWPSGVSDPWGRTVWPRPATPQATKILARCLTRLSTGQPRLYGDFSVTCLTHRYLMYLGWLMGLEPTTTGITILGSTIELQPPLFTETHTE